MGDSALAEIYDALERKLPSDPDASGTTPNIPPADSDTETPAPNTPDATSATK